jgi:hypothetical protein
MGQIVLREFPGWVELGGWKLFRTILGLYVNILYYLDTFVNLLR